MGLMGLNKGKQGERDVAKLLNGVLEKVCERHAITPMWAVKRNIAQTQQGGFDLDGIDEASCKALSWLAIEVKHHAEIKGKLGGWWRQTLEQAGAAREPILIYRGNGTKWRVRLWALLNVDAGMMPTLKSQLALEELSSKMQIKLVVAKKRLKVVADISMDDFLVWFEKRVEAVIKI